VAEFRIVFRFGVNPASPPANFLYAVNAGDNTISGYSIDPNTGALTALAGSPFIPSPYATIPDPVGMDALGTFLYVANAPTPFVNPPSCTSCTNLAGFTPNSSGDLVPLAGSPFSTQVPALSSQTPRETFFMIPAGQGRVRALTSSLW
jgi:hypothetical protein